MIVGYAPGVFDLFHVGHLNVLRRASLNCDRLVAGVTADAAVLAAKGHPAAQTEQDRLKIVRAIRYVDEAIIDPAALDKLVAWSVINFDVIFKGGDWKGTPKGDNLERDMASVGARVIYLPYTSLTSSSKLRELLGVST